MRLAEILGGFESFLTLPIHPNTLSNLYVKTYLATCYCTPNYKSDFIEYLNSLFVRKIYLKSTVTDLKILKLMF